MADDLEYLVASQQLCEIVAEKRPYLFQNSVFVWEYSVIEQKQHVNVVLRKYFREDEYTHCIPAPTLKEILAELKGSPWNCKHAEGASFVWIGTTFDEPCYHATSTDSLEDMAMQVLLLQKH